MDGIIATTIAPELPEAIERLNLDLHPLAVADGVGWLADTGLHRVLRPNMRHGALHRVSIGE